MNGASALLEVQQIRPGGDRRLVALHHLVGDVAAQYSPSLVHKAGQESMCLVVGDSLLVVDATAKGDVGAKGQR